MAEKTTKASATPAAAATGSPSAEAKSVPAKALAAGASAASDMDALMAGMGVSFVGVSDGGDETRSPQEDDDEANALIIANTNRSYGPFAASNLFAIMPAIIICPKCSNAHFDDCQCKCYWRKATDVARELRAWPDKFRVEAAELRKVNTPKATGGAIVYEDIADALDRLLKANASDQATARK